MKNTGSSDLITVPFISSYRNVTISLDCVSQNAGFREPTNELPPPFPVLLPIFSVEWFFFRSTEIFWLPYQVNAGSAVHTGVAVALIHLRFTVQSSESS